MSEWLPVADAVRPGFSRESTPASSCWVRRSPASARGCRDGSLYGATDFEERSNNFMSEWQRQRRFLKNTAAFARTTIGASLNSL
jgi:hypothetical protein